MLNLTNLTERMIELLEKDPRQPTHRLAMKLNVSKTFLLGYILALENQGCVKSKGMGLARIYFKKHGGEN
jgi:DNA-binding Lrp family transcriptional regulator